LLLLAGEHDSRCPIQQVRNYVARLEERKHPHELYLYSTGHSSFDVEQRITQLKVVLDYLSQTVPGVTRLEDVREKAPLGSA
jgi:dipeptidyl aminopeptidase/acylaminoacyl peptidase